MEIAKFESLPKEVQDFTREHGKLLEEWVQRCFTQGEAKNLNPGDFVNAVLTILSTEMIVFARSCDVPDATVLTGLTTAMQALRKQHNARADLH